ncbi:BatD family protein [Algoriphagus aestuariicola]|uniref:BatD family protein n=1 Tax=Algoriphagus aestuariicola TaxID=1852016 RepID=A0ABS3BR90_9BACT|nr:BatD family protein [Algoriphagus aestuariicola]MBN7801789.1 BatD family protein [Algoriphagus aestuariicola]
MGRSGRIVIALGLAWVLSIPSFSQSILEDVTLDKSSVYVGEPVEVTVKVYTSTWFTTGLDLGNIKVKSAFSVYFRPVSTSFQRDGQNYAGVEQIYHVFPYEVGNVTFPVLDIEVESPAPGDFKGVKHTVKTKEKTIKVKPAPAAFASAEWLVASGLSVTDHWNVDPKQVKVGEVLQRQISRTAYGTVSELIPPIAWDSLSGVSEYPSRSAVNNNKDKTSISATRTETMRYLFEKEGEVIIPEMVFTWYNPNHKKLYKRTLKEVTVQVAPNPDLGVLASVRDSLAREQEEIVKEQSAEKPKTILGMSLKQFALLMGVCVVGISLLIVVIRKVLAIYHKNHQAYLNSERYYWDLFRHEFSKGSGSSTMRSLYHWLDELHLDEPTIAHFVDRYGPPGLRNACAEGIRSGELAASVLQKNLLNDWTRARINYLTADLPAASTPVTWINP